MDSKQGAGVRLNRRGAAASSIAAAVSQAIAAAVLPHARAVAAPPPALPIPCAIGSCGSNASTFVGQGTATAVQSGKTLTVNQTSSSVLLNWQSFNIAANNTVTFKQPTSSSLALNKIFQSDPSKIMGALNANGRVYLLNQNGIIFGGGAQVNVGTLLATSLNLSPQAQSDGIAAAAASGAPALQPYVDASGKPLASGAVTVASGAQINAPQGQVFLFAPTVTNSGTISTPDGQTILAAGQRVFLAASTDPDLRGLFVEVGDGGTVTNSAATGAGAAGKIVADRGNVTLAGAVLHQDGTISATTSVRANGSIRLQARDTQAQTLDSFNVLQAERGGQLELGHGSVTAVTLDTSADTTVDVNAQPLSSVDLAGKTITIADAAVVRATGGRITALAADNPGPNVTPQQLTGKPDGSQLLIASGATLDVSGATVDLSVDRNSLAVQLRGSELADSPLQRNGALRGQTVYVDVRNYGTRADGSSWVGSPIGDLAADIANIPRTVQERNLSGGTIQLNSQGSVVVSQGATLDVAGGKINWQGGYVRTSQLIGADGQLHDISTADPNLRYTGIADAVSVNDYRWGTVQQYTAQGVAAGTYQASYVEGRSAGAVSIIAPQVVLDGSINGTIIRGPLQVRDPRTAYAGGQLIGSISDVAPSGATLTIGLPNPKGSPPDFVVSDVVFAAGSVLGGPVSAAPATLPNAGTVRLRPNLFGADGVQNLQVYANGTVTLPVGTPLSLPAGGTLSLNAGHIAVDSSVAVPSGTISLVARESAGTLLAPPSLALAPGVSIFATGGWVNDSTAGGGPSFAPLFINGGSVSISATDGAAILGQGGVIDVSGGAHLSANGTITAGSAGSISIATSSSGTPTAVSLGKQLRGFGINNGGTLSIAANSVCIAAHSCASSASELQLQPGLFDGDGFANISIASNLGSLEVLGGTTLNLRQDNLVLTGAAVTAPTGTAMGSITTVQELPDYLRKPVNLALTGSYVSKQFVDSGGLLIDAGARILGDPLASVALASNLRIQMDGTIVTPGGNIALTLNSSASTNYEPDQAIWLGADALLDASGTVVYKPDSLQPLSGTVFNGGSVALNAQRGYVFTDPNSVINVSGTAAPIDTLSYTGTFQQQQVGSNGGSISFFAVEGMQLNGVLMASGGSASGTMGGSLSVALDPTNRKGTPQGGYPIGDHDIVIAAQLAPFVVAPGTAVPAQLQGVARLASTRISQGGFDQVTLLAANQVVNDPNTGEPQLTGYGQVLFENGVSLSAGARISLEAPVIGVMGSGSAQVHAPYVSLGTDSILTMAQIAPDPVAGPGTLTVNGGFIDLVGNVAVTGVSTLSLVSASDIRARGVFSTIDSNFDGALSVAGKLDLTAQQIYPSTLANYALNATGPSGTIVTHAVAGAAGGVLSAGGTLTLNASEIDNGGTLRAPLGVLQLEAPTINALPGSVLSTSLDGQTVPFGQTQGGLDWTYPLPTGARIYDSGGAALPSQNIVLQGTTINLAKGSTVDVSGGGDLLAYEFVPGPGGTKDVLSPSVNPNQFAIIPAFHSPVAPFDPLISSDSNIAPGTQIYLSGGGGVPAGYYTVLPARYALLPGSFLVTSVTGYQDLPAGQTLAAANGGTIVSGQLGVSGTSILASRTSGFEIQPGTTALLDAQYTVSLANSFFTSTSAGSSAPVSPLLPRDAGALSIIASGSFILDSALKADVASAGRGAALQLAGNNLLVTNDPSQAAAGVVAITPRQISGFGAQTVVIGGERQNTPAGAGIDVIASSVEIGQGVQLSGPELILAAHDLLKLDDNSRITAAGTLAGATDSTLQLDANSSLLRVSVGSQLSVQRSSAGTGQGLAQFASSATITSPGSVTLDVGVSAQTSNSFDVKGSLSLAAPSIAVGAAPSNFAGVVLDPSHSDTTNVGELILSGRNSIDLYSGASFTAKSLTLETPLLQAAAAGVTVQLGANRLQLIGAPTAAASGAAAAGGALELTATEIDTSGQMSINGFTNPVLSASQLFHPVGNGVLSVDHNLTLATDWISSAAGVNYGLLAQGDVALQALPDSKPPAAALGGAFSITANSITGAVRINQPSGQILLSATGAGGDLTLGSATVLGVAGQPQVLGGQSVAAPGGTVNLTALQGSLSVAAGATVDVSAAGAGTSAGTLNLSAPQGTVAFAGSANGAGASGASGGNLSLDAGALDFAAVLNTFTTGGFTGVWNMHLGGAGDLVLPAGQQLKVAALNLTADAGAIDVAGTIDADSASGGLVALNASGPVSVTGTISARATGTGARGGEIDLSSASAIFLQPGSVLDVSGKTPSDPSLAPGGLVNLRLPGSAVQTLLDSDPGNDALRIGGTVRGARSVTIEGYRAYQMADAQILAAQVAADPSNPWYADAAAFAAQAPQILAALGKSADQTYLVLPGLEIDSPGDLHLGAEWNLYSWRFNGLPGILTVRAGGSLFIDNSLTDGFADGSTFTLPSQPSQSWSYRLAAGALLSSADPLATAPGAALTDSGSLVIAPGQPTSVFAPGVPVLVRTGTGQINIATANDVVFGNQASVIYTAGIAGPGIRLSDDQSLGGLSNLAYPLNGGSISISAGRDIIGAPSQELFTEWLWRAGAADALTPYSTAWTVAFDQFEQGVATLGGGNLSVRAGRDITDFSASTPSVGRQVGGVDPASSVVQITDGGNLIVAAGRDLLGGTYYSDLGTSQISAGRIIGASVAQPGFPSLAPVLALGGGTLEAQAVQGLTVASVVNPTLIDVSQQLPPGARTYFATYTDDAAVTLQTVAGDLYLMGDQNDLLARFPNAATGGAGSSKTPLKVLPPTVAAYDLAGSIRVGGSMSLWPAPRGNLVLVAANNVALETQSAGEYLQLLVSDASLSSLPTLAQPLSTLDSVGALLQQFSRVDPRFDAPQPVHNAPGSGLDPTPILIVANSGDVTMQIESAGKAGLLFAPKPIDVFAGEDIVNFSAQIENLTPASVSSLSAGRDFVYQIARDSHGDVQVASGGITVDGPGRLEVFAGRNVDLAASAGITTEGGLENGALGTTGADVSVWAGIGKAPAYAAFITRYLEQDDAYDQLLLNFVQQHDPQAPADQSKSAALQTLASFDLATQRGLLEQVLFAELRAGGRSAAAAGSGHDDFTRAFTALSTLFPGANPNPGSADVNPYAGDILLYFSRIYTLAGGSIDLLAPGGQINVGLAIAPTSFGITKDPAQLGLVAQSTGSINAMSYSDFQVNQSRAFAADGGNILVWSTDGDIDAGRGAKTAISAPPPLVTINSQGQVQVVFPPALSGSGIQTLATTIGTTPGDVDLFAPRGVVNANDAGIVAGNLTIAATAVLGSNNITVSGTSVGVPVTTGGLGAALAPAASSAAAASTAAEASVNNGAQEKESSLGDQALDWLDVFVLGFGEETCKPTDTECLKRQKTK